MGAPAGYRSRYMATADALSFVEIENQLNGFPIFRVRDRRWSSRRRFRLAREVTYKEAVCPWRLGSPAWRARNLPRRAPSDGNSETRIRASSARGAFPSNADRFRAFRA